MKEQYGDVGGIPMRWLEAGAGWPLVLLHAFPLCADMWRPQLERVPEGWRFIAPDLRGFGPRQQNQGRASPRPASVDDYARDICALMDRLELDDAIIGGLSMGGYVAFAMFRQSPQRFSGIILADTRPDADTAEARSARTAMRERLAADGVPAVAEQMLPKLLSERARRDDPSLVARVRELIEASDADALDAALAAMMTRPDSTSLLPRMSCPALVVVGEADEVTPASVAEAMHAALPRALLTVIPEAAHLSNLERAADFSTAVRDFLLAHL